MNLELKLLLERLRGLKVGRREPSNGLIGLDLASSGIGAVQLAGKRPDFRVRAAAWLPNDAFDPASGRRERIQRLLSTAPFRGRRVATAMPADQVKLMVLNFAASAESEAKVVLDRVRERIDEPIDECVVDFLPIRTDSERQGERSALAVVAAREAVIEHLESLRQAGLAVEVLEIAPVAVRRLVVGIGPHDAEGNVLVIHGGANRSSLTAFWGRRLILYREISFGEAPLVEELAKTLDLEASEARDMLYTYGVFPDAELPGAPQADPALSAEITQTVMEILKPSFLGMGEQIRSVLTYTASRMRGGTVAEIRLLGSLARWPGADSLLSSLTGVPVRVLDPWQGFDGAANPAGAHPSDLALATGLALHGVVRSE